jgi:hypothetical protein
MARIRTARRGGRTSVVVAGALTADDMRRLEHACGEALTVDPPPLTLELRHVSAIDPSALAVLRHLEARGALLVGQVLASIPQHVRRPRGQ